MKRLNYFQIEPKRNFDAEKYNNWNEKYLKRVKKQICASGRISEHKERTTEIIKSKEQKEKRMKKIEQSLRDLWNTIKWTNIGVVGMPSGEEREKGTKWITPENSPNLKDWNCNKCIYKSKKLKNSK